MRGGSPPHQLPGKAGGYQTRTPHPLVVVMVTGRRGNGVAATSGGGTVVEVFGALASFHEDYTWRIHLVY